MVIMPAFIELFNGATRDAATGKITLPAGATGYNTYYGRFDAVHNNRNRAGETIRLVAIFNSSTKFIQTLSSYTIGVAKNWMVFSQLVRRWQDQSDCVSLMIIRS